MPYDILFSICISPLFFIIFFHLGRRSAFKKIDRSLYLNSLVSRLCLELQTDSAKVAIIIGAALHMQEKIISDPVEALIWGSRHVGLLKVAKEKLGY